MRKSREELGRKGEAIVRKQDLAVTDGDSGSFRSRAGGYAGPLCGQADQEAHDRGGVRCKDPVRSRLRARIRLSATGVIPR